MKTRPLTRAWCKRVSFRQKVLVVGPYEFPKEAWSHICAPTRHATRSWRLIGRVGYLLWWISLHTTRWSVQHSKIKLSWKGHSSAPKNTSRRPRTRGESLSKRGLKMHRCKNSWQWQHTETLIKESAKWPMNWKSLPNASKRVNLSASSKKHL